MKIKIISVPVLDQEKALRFYTEKLKFEKKSFAREWKREPTYFREPEPLEMRVPGNED